MGYLLVDIWYIWESYILRGVKKRDMADTFQNVYCLTLKACVDYEKNLRSLNNKRTDASSSGMHSNGQINSSVSPSVLVFNGTGIFAKT